MYLGKQRKQNRWYEYDYNQFGYYFVTICIQDRIECLGMVKDDEMVLNNYGEIVLKYWQEIPKHYNDIELDEFQIMPNHHHGIIIIKTEPVGAENNVTKMPNGAGTVGTEISVGMARYVALGSVGTEQCSVPTGPIPTVHYGFLSKIIKSFKEFTVKEIRRQYNDYQFQWQRSFHDRVIRDEKELIGKRYYIQQNPAQWSSDRNNPININKK